MLCFQKSKLLKILKKIENLKFITKNYVDLNQVPPTMMNDDNERDVQKDHENIIDETIFDIDVPDEHVKQVPPEPSVEPLLRRSTRKH